MTTWNLKEAGKIPALKNPVLIEGLPGIGNVGKVAIDFMIEELKAVKIYDFLSYTFPHSVFVNEDNIVELPCIELYYKQMGGKGPDLLLLSGDVQPIDEVSCYEFCELVLDVLKQFGGTDVITLGGIGLRAVPKKPKVYMTGSSKSAVSDYKKGLNVDDKLYGVVGPIVGVSGVLLGLAGRRNMRGVALLAETYGHPMYLGVKGSKEIIVALKKRFGLNLDVEKMEKDIEELEREVVKKTNELNQVSKKSALQKLKGKLGNETSYIG
ncbi:MAG: PAC2 family protein [Nanoarchaeota archaeon]